MHLLPFTLAECEKLLESNGMVMTRGQIIDCYMIFGGIPYYLNLLDRRYSLPQKYTSDEFEISAVYDENLRRKVEAFRRETASKKALHLTLVSAQGLKPGSYSASVQQLVTADDLFV